MRHATAVAIVLAVLLVPCVYAQSGCPTVPPPTVTLVAGENPACVRNTLTLEASEGYAAYRWSDGITTRQRTKYPYSDGRTGISVVGIDANGCESEPAYYSMDQGNVLNVNVTMISGSQYLCDGAAGGTLKADSWGGGPVVSRQWEWRTVWNGPGTPIPGATGETYQVNAADLPGPGEYHIACVVTPTCGTPQSHTNYVRLGSDLPPPNPGWTPKVCLEGTGGAQIHGHYDSLLWTITNGEFVVTPYHTDDPTHPDIGFRALGEGTVTLSVTVTAAGGCTATRTLEIPVEPPVPPVLYGPSVTCPDSQRVMVSGSGIEGARQWSAVNGTLEYPYGYPNYWDDYVFVTPDGSGLPMQVILTNEPYAGCITTSTHTIAISNDPVPIEVYRGGAPACVGGTETVYAYSPNTNVTWSATNATIVSQSGNAMTFSPTSFGPVTINVTGTGGSCPGAGSFTYTPANDNPPDLNVLAPSACPGEEEIVHIRNAGQYASVTSTIVNGTIRPDSNGNPIRYTADGAGPVTITVAGVQWSGCRSFSTVTIPLRDNTPRPVIQLAQPNVCPGGYVEAFIDGTGGSTSWSVTNGSIAYGNGTNRIGIYAMSPQPPVVNVTLYGPACAIPAAPVTVPFREVQVPVITTGTADVCPFGTVTASVSGTYDVLSWNVMNGEIVSGQGTNTVSVRSTSSDFPPQIFLMVAKDGCNAAAQQVTVPFRVLAPPVITAASEVCPNSTLTASAPGTYDYMSWNVMNGEIVSGLGTNTISVRSTSSDFPPQIFLLVVKDGCNAAAQPVTVPFRVLAAPVITAASEVCPNSTLTASAPGTYDYLSWNVMNGEIVSGLGTNTISVRSTSSEFPPQIFLLVAKDGCNAAAQPVTVPFRVLAPPTILLDTPELCGTATGGASAPAGFTTYMWSVVNGTITGGEGTNHVTFHADGSAAVLVRLAVVGSDGCAAPVAEVSVPVSSPVATITAGGPTTFCDGQSVTLTASEGSSYLWTNGATTRSIVVDATGSHSVNVTVGSCTATSAPVEVTEVPAPSASISAFGPTAFCDGGSVTLTAAAGASYLWSTGATAQSIVVTTTGSYSVTVSNANGCNATSAPTAVTVHALPPATIAPTGPTTFCAGGGVWLEAPIGSYTYLWSNGTTARTLRASSSGTFTVTVTNANGCAATSSPVTVTVNVPVQPTITAGGPTTFCPGGSVTLTATEGASYLWSNGATTRAIVASPASSTSYWVEVTDANGCMLRSASQWVSVATQWKPAITAYGPTTFCSGGLLTLGTSQGAGTYLWSNGATTANITVSQSGSYSVTITNATGCSNTSDPVAVTVNPRPSAVVSGSASYCGSSSATIRADLTGTAPFTVIWSDGVTESGITASFVERVVSPSSTTTYTASVSDAVCSGNSSGSATITVKPVPPTPTVVANGPTAFCQGASVTLEAPLGNYSYLWSNGATGRFLTVSASGSYSVTVRDAQTTCTATSEPVVVTVNPAPATPAIAAGGPTSFCAGGSVTLTASAAASYLWSTGATTQAITVGASGSYTVTVANANGCTATSAATTVTANALPAPTISASGPTTFCAGGSVILTASAGSSYLWSNGATTASIAAPAGGSYSVTVTNASGCSATSAATAVTVNALPAPTITAGGPTTFCAGGSVTLTASAGSSYLWSNGATTPSITVSASGSYRVTATDENGCSAQSAATAVTVRPLPNATITSQSPLTFCEGSGAWLDAPFSGSYLWSTGATTRSIYVNATGSWSVTVTDANGCSATSAAVTTTKNTPVKPTITADGPMTFCRSGSVALTASEGVSYLWSTGATTRAITAAPTTTTGYSVYVTDANGCTLRSDVVAVVVENPEKPVILVDGPNPMCGTSVQLRPQWVSGGSTYVWSNGYVGSHMTTNQAGTYTVTATTPAGCAVTSDPVVIGSNPVPSGAITGGTASICSGGSSTITATLSGTAPFTAIWSDGVTQSGIMTNTVSRVVSPTVTTTYWLSYVTDAHCTGFGSGVANVYVSDPPPVPAITATGATTFCEGGSVGLEAPSGNYFYLWSNGATTRTTVASTSGNYTVTVRDAQTNCSTTSAPLVVTVNAAPAATITAGGPTSICTGGSVTLTASAGSSYLWSNGATGSSINVTVAGSYTVRVTNANGCSATSAATVVTVNAKPATPTITAGGPTTFCPGGSVTLTAPSGFTYLWSNGATTRAITATSAGSYSVTVTNASGCSATSTATTVAVNAATAITQQPANVTIPRNTTTTLSVTATGTGTLTYQWYRGTSPSTATPVSGATNRTYTTAKLSRGTYTYWVRVTGTCGVVNSSTATVSVP